MGIIRQLKCTSCGREWQLRLGHGMRHGILGRVMEVFPEDIQRSIAAEVDAGQLPLFRFDYRAAVCGRCRNVAAVPVLELIEKKKAFVGECPDCRGSAELLEEDLPVICPGCKNGQLEMQDIGHWD